MRREPERPRPSHPPVAPGTLTRAALAGDEAPPPQPTPIWISRRLKIALIAAGVLLLALAIWVVPAILTIVLGGVVLALILSFPVRVLSRLLPRGLAVLTTLVLLLGGLVFAGIVLAPRLIGQLTDLVAAWPSIQANLDRLLDDGIEAMRARGFLGEDDTTFGDRTRQAVSAWSRELARNALLGLLGLASSAVGVIVQSIAVLIIAIYLLLDVDKLRDSFVELAPTRQAEAADLWDTFGGSISRYLAGVVLIAAVTGAASGVALWLLGVPYALLLGAWVALTSLIPVFGTYLGVVPALPLALSQSPTTALLTLLVYVVIQNVQDNVLTPRVQGQTTHVHPIVVLVTVLWTGLAFGVFWSALAVPALVVVRVLFDFFRVRLREPPT